MYTHLFRCGDTELTLPVTPGTWQVSRGQQVEVINMHTLGDVLRLGHTTLESFSLECLLPSQLYPFCASGAVADPSGYIDQLQRWIHRSAAVFCLCSLYCSPFRPYKDSHRFLHRTAA